MAYPYRDQQYYSHQQCIPQPPHDPRSRVYYHNTPPYPQHQHYQQVVPFPVYRQQPHQIPYTYDSPPRYPVTQSRGRDYLASLTTSVNNLSISQPHTAKDKPLPSLPLPERPLAGPSCRPDSLPTYSQSIPPLPIPPAIPPRPVTQLQQTPPQDVRKSFVPSFHPHRSVSQVDLLRPPDLVRPQSDSVVPSVKDKEKSPARGRGREEIDLILDSDEESPASHRRRARSELPRSSTSKAGSSMPCTPTRNSPMKAVASPLSPHAVRCSGYTRSGQPCKRVVKTTAPFLLSRDINLGLGEAEQKEERYCKDHASRICQVGGFYWKGPLRSVWVDFYEHIPPTLSQQTQTLLRTTMESRLTDKDLPGFLYAYELRDLKTPRVSYYKIGRTDNVPRRMSEWSSQCRSHTPTLRDIFPRRTRKPPLSRFATSDLQRRETGSYLPGAFHSGSHNDDTRPRVAAMKRWERLVHLELADISSLDCPDEWRDVRAKCGDCGSVHREIFPIVRTGDKGDEYDKVVEVIGRWAVFVDKICQD